MIDIKSLRVNKKLTQTKLASLLGVTQKTISGYETEKIKPSAIVIYKLSKLFDIPIEALYKQQYNYTPDPQIQRDETADTMK